MAEEKNAKVTKKSKLENQVSRANNKKFDKIVNQKRNEKLIKK